MFDDAIPLTQLPRELSAQFARSPGYRKLYAQIIDGKLPAHRDGSRWLIRREDIPAIGAALGLAPQPTAKRRAAA
jgi:hypothetical protein